MYSSRIYSYSSEKTVKYWDTAPERRKCAVREAPQRRLLLDNDPVNIFPLKHVSLNMPGQQ
jgi:hypothetical protein